VSRIQTHWDVRAALNFILGGAGSGLIVVSAFSPRPHAVLLGLLMVAAGLTAVWLEIGKPLRALHVLFNPFTSWMTRESFAAFLLFPLGLGTLFVPAALPAAALAAFAFLFCQAKILHAAKGIPAWRAPQVVALLLTTGLAEGAGLALFFGIDTPVVGLFALALLARAIAWSRYRAAVRSEALEPAGRALVQLGTIVALALLAMSFAFEAAAFLAAAAAIAGGWRLKLALVTRAASTQGFTLPHVPVRGAR
jgi:phenylacetyl-CoA:acceptor oxidoreductase subunit 2